MILCDTNILIEFYKSNNDIVQEFQKIGSPNIAISTITRAELYYGAINKTELFQIKKHLDLIVNLPLDQTISAEFIKLMLDYSLSHKLTIPDAIIAATAIIHDLDLYTLNVKDFRFINELKLYQITP